MSFNIECPGCLTPYSLADGERGKPFRCTTCHNVFVAGAEAEAEAPRTVQPEDTVAAEAPKMIQLIDEEPYVAMPVDSRESARRRTADKRSAPPQAPRKKKRSGERLAVLITALIAVVMVGGAGAAIGYRVWTAPEKKQTQKTGGVVSQVPRPRGIVVQPVTRRIDLDCEDRAVGGVFFSDEATHQAVVIRVADLVKFQADRYDLVGHKRLSSFPLNVAGVTDHMSLSPGGTRLAYDDGQQVVIIVSAQDGREAARFRPYAPNPALGARDLPFEHLLARFDLIAENRLLTINQAGGMDVWTVPELQPVYHVPGKPARQLADPHQSLGLSHDRKTLAIVNRDGFELRNTATGALLRETERPARFNAVFGTGGVAFSADGKTLVAVVTVHQRNIPTPVLASWDVATGRCVSDAEMPERDIAVRSELLWWGPKYVVIRGASAKEGAALEWPSGAQVRQLEAGYWQKNGLIAPNSPDGRLWFVAGTDDSTKAFLATVDVPENERRMEGDRPKERWWLTANGIMK
jgi:hypothetical protein